MLAARINWIFFCFTVSAIWKSINIRRSQSHYEGRTTQLGDRRKEMMDETLSLAFSVSEWLRHFHRSRCVIRWHELCWWWWDLFSSWNFPWLSLLIVLKFGNCPTRNSMCEKTNGLTETTATLCSIYEKTQSLQLFAWFHQLTSVSEKDLNFG